MVKNKLIKNSLFGTIQVLLTACLTFVSVPVFINALGLELYGVFALISVVGNLNILINFGLNSALLVYVAKQGKCKESDSDIAVTLIILILLVILLSSIAIIFGNFIIEDILKIPISFLIESKKLFFLLVVSNAIILMGQTFTAILDALQKIYITNICQFIYSCIYWIGMILVVALGGGLKQVGFMALTASIIWFFILFIITYFVWGKLSLKGLKNGFKRVLVKQLSYGSKIYATGIIGFMFEPLSKILLSNFNGLHAVALFEIGIKVKSQINTIFSKAFYPLLPFIANSQDSNELKAKLYDFSKKIQLLVIPITIILVFTLKFLTKLWLGYQNLDQAFVFVIILTITVLLFSLPIIPIYQYLIAKDKAEKNLFLQLLTVIVNLAVFILFYRIIGLFTILLANLLGYLASFVVGNYYQYKYFGAKYWNERFYYAKLLFYGIVCFLVCSTINILIPLGFWDLIIYPLVVGGSFVLFVRKQKLITKTDLETYFHSTPSFKRRMTNIFIS